MTTAQTMVVIRAAIGDLILAEASADILRYFVEALQAVEFADRSATSDGRPIDSPILAIEARLDRLAEVVEKALEKLESTDSKTEYLD